MNEVSLTSGRFSSELNAYKESQVAPMTAEAAANAAAGAAASTSSSGSTTEWLASDSVASRVQDELLRQQLWHVIGPPT